MHYHVPSPLIVAHDQSSGMSTAAAQSCTYQRRRPELTPCYQIIAGHLNTFIAEREAEQRPLPDYVINEFEAYLICGILAHGFIRLKCTTCSAESKQGGI